MTPRLGYLYLCTNILLVAVTGRLFVLQAIDRIRASSTNIICTKPTIIITQLDYIQPLRPPTYLQPFLTPILNEAPACPQPPSPPAQSAQCHLTYSHPRRRPPSLSAAAAQPVSDSHLRCVVAIPFSIPLPLPPRPCPPSSLPHTT